MRRSIALAVALASGCGTAPDDRPATLEVITLEILAPTCGQVQCHSSTTNLRGYALDTVAGARAALADKTSQDGLLKVSNGKTKLIEVIEATGGKRMPPDVPLADEDIALLQKWIDGGELGL